MAKYAGPDDTAGAVGTTVPEGERFAVRRMARLLSVSSSGYYAYVKRCAATILTPRQQRRADLEVKITQAHKDSRGTYGSPRITAELRDQGEVVSTKTVAKVMAGIGIEGISPVLAENVVRAGQAAWGYSLWMPPSRCRRRMSRWVTAALSVAGGSGCSGRALAMP